MKSRSHSPETREKMRKAATGKRFAEHPWWVGAKVYSTRRNALDRELEWLLEESDAKQLVLGACAYCGATSKPQSLSVRGWNLAGVNGIDRVDNAQPYRLENCVTCCAACNRAKHMMTRDEFLAWVKRVVTHLNL